MSTAYIYRWGLSIMMASGLTGNAISMVVFSSKAFSTTSSGFYLRVLCIADTLVIGYIVMFLSSNGFGFRMDSLSEAACKIRGLLNYVPFAWSAWVEALVCMDRFLTIVASNHFKFLNKRTCWYVAMIASFLLNLAVYSPNLYYFYLWPISNSTNICTWSDDYDLVLTWVDLFNSTIVPFALMLLSSLGISVKLAISRKKVASSSSTSDASNRQLKARKKRDLIFAVNSIGLNIFFLFCNMSIVVFYQLSADGVVSRDGNPYLYAFSIFAVFTNYTGKFYLYLTMNKLFRTEFVNLLCGSRSRTAETSDNHHIRVSRKH